MEIKPWIFGVLFICAIIVYIIIFLGTAYLAIEFLQPIWAFFVAYAFGMMTACLAVSLLDKDNVKDKNKEEK